MYKITSKWTALAPPSPRISLAPPTPPHHHHHHYSSPRATSSSRFILYDGAEFFETYDYDKSDGRSQMHGNSERQHVPDFSVTEQLEMNKNTLFTQFFSVRTFTTCHLYIYTEYACAHTSV